MRHLAVRVHDADSVRDAEIAPELLGYLADAIDHYLNGKDSIESSLGLRKRRHLAWLDAETPHIVRDLYQLELRNGRNGAIARTARGVRLRRKQVERILYPKRTRETASSLPRRLQRK